MNDGSEQHIAALLDALRNVLCHVAEPRSVLKEILQQSVLLTGADRGLLVELADGDAIGHQVLVGVTTDQYDGPAWNFSRHLTRRVLETGDDVMLQKAHDDPYFQRAESMAAIGQAAILCVPIRGEGRIAAIVYLEKQAAGSFDDSHRVVLRQLAAMAGRVLESVRANTEQRRLAEDLQREETAQREELKQDWAFGRFLGRSPAVAGLERTLRKVAGRDVPLLILGETGTGKSILARAIHFEGPRSAKAFVTVFCPSMEKALVEGELFGHRKGSFTNATDDRTGKVQLADGGTLFLDEVGDLSLEIQGKLLRLLEEGTYEKVGDPHERKANVRIIAATNRDLAADVASGRFRAYLLARLDVFPIRVPPLRERIEDIGLLLRDCLDREQGGRWITLTPGAIEYLEKLPFSWPNNVRHLKSLAARLAAESPDGPVTAEMVADLLQHQNGPAKPGRPDPEAGGIKAAKKEAQRQLLSDALARYPNLSRAQLAEKLQISESTLYKWLAEGEQDLG